MNRYIEKDMEGLKESEFQMDDLELARTLANTMSGNVSEWPQLKPLLIRLVEKIEKLQQYNFHSTRTNGPFSE